MFDIYFYSKNNSTVIKQLQELELINIPRLGEYVYDGEACEYNKADYFKVEKVEHFPSSERTTIVVHCYPHWYVNEQE